MEADVTAFGRQQNRRLCEACRARITVGTPRATETWPASISINEHQLDLLMAAAAEYKDLCDEAGEYADPVEFLDWVRPDALSPTFGSPVNLHLGKLA